MDNPQAMMKQFNSINKEIIRSAKTLHKAHLRRVRIYADINSDAEAQIEKHKQNLTSKGSPVIEQIKNPPFFHSKDLLSDLKVIIRYETMFHNKVEKNVLEILTKYQPVWGQVNKIPTELIEKYAGMRKEKYVHYITIIHRILNLYVASVGSHKQLIEIERRYVRNPSQSLFFQMEELWKQRLHYAKEFENYASEIKASRKDFLKAKIFKDIPVKHAGASGIMLSVASLVFMAQELDPLYILLGLGIGLVGVVVNLRSVWSVEYHNMYDEQEKLNLAVAQFDRMVHQ